MKAIVYIHYGSTVFDSSKGFPIRNETNWSKPRGGLWASRQNSTFGWKTWCEQEEFRDCDEHNSFKFRLRDNAKMAVIHNMKDLRCLPTIKSSTSSFWDKLCVVFGIGVFAGLAGGFVVSKKCILKSMEKYLQSDECKNEIKSRVDKLLNDLVSE